MEKEVLISREGYERWKVELAEIEGVKLKNIAEKIAEAKDMGDLSENAEYHEAKEQQAFLYGKAQALKYKIKNARMIEECGKTAGSVSVGSSVTVNDGKEDWTISLVGSDESDPANNKISVDSPIGQAVLGAKVGDLAIAETPAGEMKYKILKIS